MSHKKGQAAIEFLIIFATVLFVFSILMIVLYGFVVDKEKEKQLDLMRNIGLQIQEEIVLAQSSSEGYNRSFYVSENILGRAYNLNFSTGLLSLDFEGLSVSYPVLNISGVIREGQNIMIKKGGVVYANS